MKHLLYLFLFASVALTSCDKDDDCNAGTLSSVIVGRWDVTALGVILGEVEFESNGNLIDNSEALVDSKVGDDLSYTVSGNTSITLRAEDATSFQEDTYTVTEFDCDEVKVDTGLGIIATLKRK